METTSDREERFRALYTDAYGDVLRFIQRRVDPSHAEDVAAEAFLVAWRRFDDAPRSPDDQRAWLFGVARNCLLNATRGGRRRDALAVRIASISPPGGAGGADGEEHIAGRLDVAAAWARLTATQQEVLSLAVFEDLASPQAARILGITPASYRLRLHRARRALRRRLDEPHPARPATQETYA